MTPTTMPRIKPELLSDSSIRTVSVVVGVSEDVTFAVMDADVVCILLLVISVSIVNKVVVVVVVVVMVAHARALHVQLDGFGEKQSCL